MQQLKNMGSIKNMLGMLPGARGMKQQLENFDETEIERTEAIIRSMTIQERRMPKLLNGSRRLRIAKGSGTTVTEVNSLVNRFEQAAKMMKTVAKGGDAERSRHGPDPGRTVRRRRRPSRSRRRAPVRATRPSARRRTRHSRPVQRPGRRHPVPVSASAVNARTDAEPATLKSSSDAMQKSSRRACRLVRSRHAGYRGWLNSHAHSPSAPQVAPQHALYPNIRDTVAALEARSASTSSSTGTTSTR